MEGGEGEGFSIAGDFPTCDIFLNGEISITQLAKSLRKYFFDLREIVFRLACHVCVLLSICTAPTPEGT